MSLAISVCATGTQSMVHSIEHVTWSNEPIPLGHICGVWLQLCGSQAVGARLSQLALAVSLALSTRLRLLPGLQAVVWSMQ